MQGNELANGAQRHTGGTGRGLKALRIGGLLAATLTLSAGLAVVGTAAAAAGVAVGGIGVAYGACQHVEADLAADLGVSVAALRATDPAAVPAQLAARVGVLTPMQAQDAADRAEAYNGCREVFADVDAAWDDR
jgi:hypothetical protein